MSPDERPDRAEPSPMAREGRLVAASGARLLNKAGLPALLAALASASFSLLCGVTPQMLLQPVIAAKFTIVVTIAVLLGKGIRWLWIRLDAVIGLLIGAGLHAAHWRTADDWERDRKNLGDALIYGRTCRDAFASMTAASSVRVAIESRPPCEASAVQETHSAKV